MGVFGIKVFCLKTCVYLTLILVFTHVVYRVYNVIVNLCYKKSKTLDHNNIVAVMTV